jgi:osmoprotectant transport system permease protein
MAELVRWSWVENNLDDIQQATIEHLELVGAALGVAIAISIPIAILVRRRRIPFVAVNTISGALYTIPSLAMFAFLLSFVGIGFEPAVIALAVYCLQLIIRNTVVGLQGVSAPVQEAARGMGLTRRQTLTRVELPRSSPASGWRPSAPSASPPSPSTSAPAGSAS